MQIHQATGDVPGGTAPAAREPRAQEPRAQEPRALEPHAREHRAARPPAGGVLPAAPSPGATRLQVHVHDTWAGLVDDAVASIIADIPDDPFAEVQVVVRGAAARRALSQAVARATGRDDTGGVCSGISFVTLGQLRRDVVEEVLGQPAASDPWRRRALAMAVLQVLQENGDTPWFEPLAQHLHPLAEPDRSAERPGRWLATAQRVATLLSRYVRDAPGMLRCWSAGDDVDTAGEPLGVHDRWQPEVWRACRRMLAPVPDPVERHDQLVAALHQQPAAVDTVPLLVVDPGPMSRADHEFLAALAGTRPVCLHVLRPAGDQTPWGARLGRSERAGLALLEADGAQVVEHVRSTTPTTLLQALQAHLSGDATARPGSLHHDRSVQVHASHAPDRQVEVLRDVLAGLFADDPTLEPRDVVVVCPDLDRFAPLVRASFGGASTQGDAEWGQVTRHPATDLRVQVAGSSLTEPNPALALLQTLLALPTSRATSQDLLDLCAMGVVSHRFGLDTADIDLLARLLAAAEVRWGVDMGHRQRFGVGGVRQSTWLAGIDRLLVGVTMGEQPAGWLDTVAPVGMIGSKHLDAIGAVSEIVSRVRRLVALWSSDATMSDWVARLREALDQLAARSGPDAVVVAHARAQLAALADLTVDSRALVSRGDLRGQFDTLLHAGSGRANHGNGSLLVTRLGDLDDVSHRVVVLLGLDDGVLPPPPRHDGDDLVPELGTPETGVREVALRHFHEALRAARDTFVVVHQGFDPRTNEAVPPAPLLVDLVAACRPLGGVHTVRHTLLAESLRNFLGDDESPPTSFDPVALRGALALDRRVVTRVEDLEQPPLATPPVDAAEPPGPVITEVGELVQFLRNPASTHLTARLGVSLTRYDTDLDPDIPIEADGLVRWKLGERFLAAELAGESLDEVERLARLGGDLPPGRLADRPADQTRSKALRIAHAVMARTTVPGSRERIQPDHRRLRVDLAGFDAGVLLGQVRTVNDMLVSWRFGATRLVDLLDAWLHLLALQAQFPSPAWRAVCVGSDGVARLRPPDADTSRALLAGMVHLRQANLRHVVPLPLEVVAELTDIDPGAETWGRTRDEQREAQRAWEKLRERPEWRMSLNVDYPTLLRLPVDPTDPGQPGARDGRFDHLRHWLVDPLLAHLDREAL